MHYTGANLWAQEVQQEKRDPVRSPATTESVSDGSSPRCLPDPDNIHNLTGVNYCY